MAPLVLAVIAITLVGVGVFAGYRAIVGPKDDFERQVGTILWAWGNTVDYFERYVATDSAADREVATQSATIVLLAQDNLRFMPEPAEYRGAKHELIAAFATQQTVFQQEAYDRFFATILRHGIRAQLPQ